ncbi:MAG: DUF3226 domain-containing protein [Promethearchaeota archaeon]
MNECIDGSIKEKGNKGIPKRISRSKILLVEGDDDYHFFKHFFLFEKINIDEIHIIRTCGDFDEDYVNALVIRSDFVDNIKIFGIISEANSIGIQRKFEIIKDRFENTNLTFPDKPNSFTTKYPKGGIFIIGNDDDIKILEDLCLKSIEKDKEMTCVKEFTNCISKLNIIYDNPSKAQAQAYLASKPKYIAHIGLGAKENYWNFESTIYNDIKRFLNEFK